jgi:carbonic anhydrase/acetyltransferase-like protein (isoleucine patch superfamily)
MALYQLGDDAPQIPASAYVADEAVVIGRVTLGERTSVWPGATIRGDNEPIRIGNDVNIQDGAVLHVDPDCPLTIGDFVSVGHQAMLHGCTVGDNSLIGIQAVIMNNAVIGKDCLVGAGAIVTEGKVFPDRTLILGAPAKVVRELTDKDVAFLRGNAGNYVERQQMYKAKLKRIG